jgi:stearoyl-CoA desaturase (delta-9 desaturase)
MTAPTAAPPTETADVRYEAGSPRAPWNQPEVETPDGTGLRQSLGERIVLGLFIALPFLAMLAAIPVAAVFGWISWLDVALAVVMYVISGHGITVGFHRYFTHGSFRANRPLRVALAVAGSLAIEGPVNTWVADHRKHHKFSDKDGDPHSPWRFGQSTGGLVKGLAYAHVGWLFDIEQTDQRQYVPDLLRDKDISRVSRAFPGLVAVSLLFPPLVGGLVTWSWAGAATAFFWASLVRVGLLHHVTWSINSICHAIGERPFASRDRSGNVWWLAALSMGESWHNLHHADPTCARHGVLRGQIDSSARTIWAFEKLGWATSVRWPKPERLAGKRAALGDVNAPAAG